jgi:uncharacterized protein (DUF488 family)
VQATPAARTLFTVGYQGHLIETLLDLLMAHGIEHIIDVRQLRFSRKPDSGKKQLTAHLAAVGIGYTHLVQLATPNRYMMRCVTPAITRRSWGLATIRDLTRHRT